MKTIQFDKNQFIPEDAPDAVVTEHIFKFTADTATVTLTITVVKDNLLHAMSGDTGYVDFRISDRVLLTNVALCRQLRGLSWSDSLHAQQGVVAGINNTLLQIERKILNGTVDGEFAHRTINAYMFAQRAINSIGLPVLEQLAMEAVK